MGVDRAYFVQGSTVQPYDIDDDVALDVRWQLDDVWEAMPPAFAAGMDAALDLGTFSLFSFRGADCLRIPCVVPAGASSRPSSSPLSSSRPSSSRPSSSRSASSRPRLGLHTVDAAMTWGDGTAYLFSGDVHVCYDIARDRPVPGYPRPVADGWPGLDPDWVGAGIDAALNPGNGVAYLFKGTDYVAVDWHTRVPLGRPRPIETGWKGLTGPFDAAWCGAAPPPPPAPPAGTVAAFSARAGAAALVTELVFAVPALVTLGQAALHSDWGRNAPDDDLFGLGPAASAAAAFQAYGRHLRENPRYAHAFTHRDDPFPFARAVAAARPAADPADAARLTARMHQLRGRTTGAIPRSRRPTG